MTEENQVDTPTTKEEGDESAGLNMKELLFQQHEGPNAAQIEQWKGLYGEIFVSGFSETEMTVWRPLRRTEFKKLQESLTSGETDQFKYEEMIVETCVIWPPLAQAGAHTFNTKAGTVSTLAEQIMTHSNFINPQVAASLVQKL